MVVLKNHIERQYRVKTHCKGQKMKITKIMVKNFKALHDVDFKPGSVNVFVGTNGVGKSALLEAIGILSAAINEQVEDESLYRRGVRLGTPSAYKSSLECLKKRPNTIELAINWTEDSDVFNYKINLSNPSDKPESYWNFFSESLHIDGENSPELTRGSRPKKIGVNGNGSDVNVDKYRSMLSFYKNTNQTEYLSNFYNLFRDYAIYTPTTDVLRGVNSDSSQKKPIGLRGGRLADAVDDLLRGDSFGNMDIDDLFELLGWVSDIRVGKPQKDMIPTGVPTPLRIIQFTDKYMKANQNQLSSYDASEGALYVLFMLTLSLHPQAPQAFAIDNFDQAMNPRLARATMRSFCSNIINNNKVAFVTTHNPLVLDGLDLTNDEIRLFTMDRDKDGATFIEPVELSSSLDELSLSRLWISGALGGVPNL